jgi:hypothetical protein
MLDDIIFEYGTEEEIKAYLEYCERIDNKPKNPFIICSKELAEQLQSIFDEKK